MTSLPASDRNAVLQNLERNPIFIRSLVAEFPADRLRQRPTNGKWSAHEHVCHLDVVHPIFFARLDSMLADGPSIIEPYFPDQAHNDGALLEMNLEQSMARYAKDRQTFVERLRDLKQDDWARTAQHEEYFRYDIFIMARHLAMHDIFHAYRIEELLLTRV